MSTVRITGGLGNQLFQIVFAYRIFLSTGKRVTLDCSLYEMQTVHNGFRAAELLPNLPHFFDLRTHGFKTVLARKAWQWGYRSRLTRLLLSPRVSFESREFHFSPLKMSRSRLYLGYFQALGYFPDTPSLRDGLLKIDMQFSSKAAAQLAKDITDSPHSVCLHIRRGDYVGNARHPLMPLAYYQEGLLRLQKSGLPLAIFIFSDDSQLDTRPFESYGTVTFVSPITNCHDLDELRLMQLCQSFVIANSTFSWWAAWLAQHPRKQVYYPAVWFGVPAMPIQELFPSDWEKLTWTSEPESA